MAVYAPLSQRRKEPEQARQSAPPSSAPSLQALQAGAMPTQEQMGHQVDLPEAIRAKMEASFGADLSGVQLYESQTVADAGAEAITMGNKIGFAPGRLDFVSSGGQELLGHELSHVVSQARGEVSGSGFLSDHALEARADREGAMAAAGESVYSGPVTPISTTSSALSAAGPMQAKKTRSAKGRDKLLAPGYDPTADLSGTQTDSTDDGTLFTSVFGTHTDRTASNPAAAGMTEMSPRLNGRSMITAYNNARMYTLPNQGNDLSKEQKEAEQASQYTGGVRENGTAKVGVNFVNDQTQNRLQGRVFKPAPSVDNGKRVVLYSGSGGSNFNQMHDQMLQYLDAGYTVYAYDYGGFGESKNKDDHPTQVSEKSMAQDSQAIYDHVAAMTQDVEGRDFSARDTLIHGFSMGGAMASHVARNAAIKAAKSGDDKDKLGGLVLESAMRSTYDAAAGADVGMGPLNGVASRLGGALGSHRHGSFDTLANLKETAALDADMPVTFLTGTETGGDQLAESATNLHRDAQGLFQNTQLATVDSDHMNGKKLTAAWRQIAPSLMRTAPATTGRSIISPTINTQHVIRPFTEQTGKDGKKTLQLDNSARPYDSYASPLLTGSVRRKRNGV